jgi:hypothetical protein
MRLPAVSLAAVLLASTAQAAMIHLVPDHGTYFVSVEINGASPGRWRKVTYDEYVEWRRWRKLTPAQQFSCPKSDGF